MEALLSLIIGTLTASGVYLVLRRRTFPLVLGLTLLSYAVNLFLFASGRLQVGMPPVIRDGAPGYTDPLPQALVLTAIVIGFAMTAFLIMLALKARATLGSDDVNAGLPGSDSAAPTAGPTFRDDPLRPLTRARARRPDGHPAGRPDGGAA